MMAGKNNSGQTKDIVGVTALGGVALVFAILLAVGLPFLSRVDPTSPNVMKHRLREAFCAPRIEHRVECLQECATDQGDDYQDQACELLPRDNPTQADQERLEAELTTRSPCAGECQTNWKTHSVWCAQGIEKAKLDGIDACIFEGATIALFDYKEARCLEQCPDADPDGDLYLTSRDTCMITCMVATMVEEPDPEDARQLAQDLMGESDFRVRQRLEEIAEPPTPPDFEMIRRECRLAHPRATFDLELLEKRDMEFAFRDCVYQRLTSAADPAPADVVPADEVPADPAPADVVPADPAPVDDVPADAVPADDAPEGSVPADPGAP